MDRKSKYDFNFNRKLVLVVEDNPVSFKLIEAMLTRVNLALLHACNGKEAIDLCMSNPEIEIVLMDMQLPVISGFQATRSITEFRPELPVIATTANAFSEDKAACMDAGCTAFISKPIAFEELFKLMDSILKQKK